MKSQGPGPGEEGLTVVQVRLKTQQAVAAAGHLFDEMDEGLTPTVVVQARVSGTPSVPDISTDETTHVTFQVSADNPTGNPDVQIGTSTTAGWLEEQRRRLDAAITIGTEWPDIFGDRDKQGALVRWLKAEGWTSEDIHTFIPAVLHAERPDGDINVNHLVLADRRGSDPEDRTLTELIGRKAVEGLRKKLGLNHRPRYVPAWDGLYTWSEDEEGLEWSKMTNWVARVTHEELHDNGVEQTRHYRIQARLTPTGTNTPTQSTFTLPATDFDAVQTWTDEYLGARATINASTYNKIVKTAVKSISQHATETHIYKHTGWRQANGNWVYLHANGAIGPDGALENITVDLPNDLANYTLPEPPNGQDLTAAVQASLDVLDAAEHRITLPLLAAIYRAPLGHAPLTMHLTGPSGAMKTSLAAVFLQHYGPTMTPEALPAGWNSTGNSLEHLAFLAKDAPLLVDDFAPSGPPGHANRLYQKAERLVRAQANKTGRVRMTPDGSLQATKTPRGLLLSTGEDLPIGHSLRARFTILPVEQGDVDTDNLTQAQGNASDGVLAQAMAGYLQWVAPRKEDLADRVDERLRALRNQDIQTEHGRTLDNIAHLMAGWEVFLEYAEHADAITPEEKERLCDQAWATLCGVAKEQGEYVEDQDPVDQFLTLLISGLQTGRFHLTTKEGGAPDNPTRWGWAKETEGKAKHRPQGKHIGWWTDDAVLLDPRAAYAEVKRYGQEDGASFLTRQRLFKQVRDALDLTHDDNRTTVRKRISGKTKRLVRIPWTKLPGGALGPRHLQGTLDKMAQAIPDTPVYLRSEDDRDNGTASSPAV